MHVPRERRNPTHKASFTLQPSARIVHARKTNVHCHSLWVIIATGIIFSYKNMSISFWKAKNPDSILPQLSHKTALQGKSHEWDSILAKNVQK
jgi:hypothetical protein